MYISRKSSSNSSIETHTRAAAAAAALCMQYKTDFSIAYTTPQSSSYIPGMFIFTLLVTKYMRQQKNVKMAHKKKPPSEVRTTNPDIRGFDLPATPLYSLNKQTIGMYLYVRTDDWDILTRNETGTRRRETTRARPRPPPAESEEASKVRHDEPTAHRMVSNSSYLSALNSYPKTCLLYTSPSPRDLSTSRMPSSA